VNTQWGAVACALTMLLACLLPASGQTASGQTASYCADPGAVFKARVAYVGINDIELPGSSFSYQTCSAGRYAAGDMGVYRAPLTWSAVEQTPRHYNFSEYDQLVYALALHHVTWLPVLLQPPSFRAKHVAGRTDGILPPSNASQFGAFAAICVRRYGPNGTFWKEYPKLPRMVIHAWQIWNEPNLPSYWWPKPSPAGYTQLLKAAYKAIKHVDPTADVVSAGMPWYSSSIAAVPFLNYMFRHGALRSLTTLGFNGWSPGPEYELDRLIALRQMLDRFGARKVKLWLTEFGWAVGGPRSVYTVSSARNQARDIARFVQLVAAHRRSLELRGIIYYDWRDQPLLGRSDFFGLHTGLLTVSGQVRPALAVVVRAARMLDR
jgi:hypothetical protein